MYNEYFTELIESQFETYERRYTRLYDQVLTDFVMIDEQKTNGFKDSIMHHMLLNSNLDGCTMEELYYNCYECYDQQDGYMIEIELDYLIDNITYDNVRDSMRDVYDQVN